MCFRCVNQGLGAALCQADISVSGHQAGAVRDHFLSPQAGLFQRRSGFAGTFLLFHYLILEDFHQHSVTDHLTDGYHIQNVVTRWK